MASRTFCAALLCVTLLPAPAAAAEERGTSAVRQLNWAWNCADGRYVVSSYQDDDLWLFLPEETVRLVRQQAASGARYSDGSITFWSKGEEAVLETPSGRTQCTVDAEASVWEDAKLRGFDLLAMGNEPGWRLELSASQPSRMLVDDGQRRLSFDAAGPLPLTPGPGSLFTGRADGMDVVIVLSPGPCRDSMSEREFGTRVRVLLDDRVLVGCGDALH
jgi:membrane-bound inhibitor of C-type lysozyme